MKKLYENFPQNIEELNNFDTFNQEDPFCVVASFISILPIAKKDINQYFTMLELLQGSEMNNFDKQFINNRMRDKNESFTYAYFAGATPENGYTPDIPYEVEITENNYSYEEDGYIKLFVKTNGADSPRPITLEKRESNWFIKEYSSIFLGVK